MASPEETPMPSATGCLDYGWHAVYDEDGNRQRYTEPHPCRYPVYQTLYRCGWCLAVIFSDDVCDRCAHRGDVEVERRCHIHKLSDRDIFYSRGVTLPPPTQRELLTQVLGL
jgi:hypothetical protein